MIGNRSKGQPLKHSASCAVISSTRFMVSNSGDADDDAGGGTATLSAFFGLAVLIFTRDAIADIIAG